MAVLGRKLSTSSTGGPITSAVCWLLTRFHAGTVAGLRFVGRPIGKAVGVLPWPVRLACLSAVLGCAAILLWLRGEAWLVALAELRPTQLKILTRAGVLPGFRALCTVSGWVGWALGATALAALVPRRFALAALRVAGAGFAAVWLWLLVFLVRAPSTLYDLDSDHFSKATRDALWIGGIWGWVPLALLAAAFVLCLMHREVQRRYTGRGGQERQLGDRVFSSLRTHGRDPNFRTSTYWSAFAHLAVFFLPVLLRSCGTEEPYGIPKGSGVEMIQTIQVKRVKRKKKDRLVLNMNSPIIFHSPKIDDSDIQKDLEELTQDQYEATALRKKPGKGGGSTGGWPHGMANARVRFIRLKYGGGDWDQDMGYAGDYNLLLKFRDITGFKIAANTEAMEIYRLRRFPKHKAPPFVFITGRGGMRLSAAEEKTLRWYCLEEGGMIFADNGGGHFGRSFRSLVRRAFPELPLVDIASDDPIFRQPFSFPGGAPPLWHHDGRRALGVKHEGRWVVFYHPGDIADAWKTGHSGASKAVAARAYRLGVNVMFYAFTQYLARHYGG